jgi:tripartite-type tricarboxylate transporter receptor subunit TctC
MITSMSRLASCVLAAAIACFAATLAHAEDAVPSKPVRLIVPVAAGGGIDTAFRAIAPAWGEALGVPVVVENRPGGGQIIGTDAVAKAKPDGYTLLAAGVPIAFNTALGRKLPYDPVKDLTPIAEVVTQPLLVVVNPAVPVKSMTELVAYAKAQPQPLQYTTGGIGSYGHLWWEMLRARLELPGQHVAYNGIAPALKDAIGGQVPLLIDAIVPTGAQVKAGTVRGLAIVSKSRARSLPDVPTLAEQGYPGLDAAPFYGILGPAHLDPAVVRKLNSTLITVLNSTAVKAQLQEQGFDVVAGSPEAYGKLIGDEIARWTAVVQRAGIKVE